MKNFAYLYKAHSTQIPNWILVVFLLVAFFGFLDASFLTLKSYLGGPIPCAIVDGCEEVTTSKYAALFGIPIALFGALYYFFLFVVMLLFFDTQKNIFLFLAVMAVPFGFFVSFVLLYLQVFVIGALCFYCLLSALTSTVLAGIGIALFFIMNRQKHAQ